MLPRFSALRSNGLSIWLSRIFSLCAVSEQVFEALVHRNPIGVGEPVGLIGHADDGDEFAEHLPGHAEPLGGGAVRMGAIGAAVADADREIKHFLDRRVERAGAMTSLMLSQVRFRVAGSLASA